jgi:hypothetical protein
MSKRIFGKNIVNRVARTLEHVLQDLPNGAPIGLFNALGHEKFTRAVEFDEETKLALGRSQVCRSAISM